MNKKEKTSLVPKLRFPEFRDSGEWEVGSLSNLCNMQAGKFVQASAIHEKRKNNMYPCYGGNGLRGYTSSFTHSGEYSLIGRQGALCGNVTYVTGDFHATEHAVVTIKKHNIYTKWLYFLLITINLNQYATGQAQPGLSVQLLEKIGTYAPKLIEEQKKIADCLSSLDDLISAEDKKLKALNDHKKGLMQKLFPTEGKTVPEFRFPEFRDSGEWEDTELNRISPYIYDGTHQTPSYTNEGIPFYSVENLVSGNKNKFISYSDYLVTTTKHKPEKGDILLTRIGKIGFSQVVTWDFDFSVYVTLAVIKKSESFNSYYLHSFIQSELYQTELMSKSLLNAVPCKINMDSLRKTKIFLPKINEQQRIADCFSSIDDLISAQSEKIKALKSHKKGLMQGLFPSVAEVEE